MENGNNSPMKPLMKGRTSKVDSLWKIKVPDERGDAFPVKKSEGEEEEKNSDKAACFKNSAPDCFETVEWLPIEPDEDTQEANFTDLEAEIEIYKCMKEDTDSISIIDIKAFKEAAFSTTAELIHDRSENYKEKTISTSFSSTETVFVKPLEDSLNSSNENYKTDLISTLKQTVSNTNTDIKTDELGTLKKELTDQQSEAKVECNQSDSIIFEDRQLPIADMFVCQSCGRVFSNQYKLDSHQFRNHISSESDKQSNYRSENNDIWPPNVQKLARRVNGIKVFFCNLCSYSVNRCDSMSKHMLRVHSEGRVVPQYMCEVCGKVFIDKAYLRNHSVSHVTDKQHSCEVCGQMFHRQASLKRHQQSHSADKQFACTLCEYKTNRKHLMYKHVDYHKTGRSYTCKFCDSKFYTQISFRSHMYSHQISPNSCSFCKVHFSSKERMMCHLKKVHFAYEIKELDKLKELKEEHESLQECKVFEV